VFGCDPAAGRSLTAGQRNKHHALHPTDAVPDGLTCVTCLGYREIECGGGGIVGRHVVVEDVVQAVGEQDGPLRMTARDGEKLVDGIVIAETIGLEQFLNVPCCLV
jgi:hypothetical protein